MGPSSTLTYTLATTMISHLALLCKYLFGLLHACIFYLFFPFFSPISHTVPIKKTVIISVEWLLFGGYWLCLSYLINTGNTTYRGMRENAQKMMPSVAVSFLRHQNWCRMLKPLWPQYCYELQAGKSSGEPTGSREMLQRESTSWNALEDWYLKQGKNGSELLCTFSSGDE